MFDFLYFYTCSPVVYCIVLRKNSVCFFNLLHPYCYHARGILCGVYTSCMGSLILIVHAEWSHVFQYFTTSSQRPKTAISQIIIIITKIISVISLINISTYTQVWRTCSTHLRTSPRAGFKWCTIAACPSTCTAPLESAP